MALTQATSLIAESGQALGGGRIPETSPLRDVYKDWERRFTEAMMRGWRRKAERLAAELRRLYPSKGRMAIKQANLGLPPEFWEWWALGYIDDIGPYITEAVQIGARLAEADLSARFAITAAGGWEGDIATWASRNTMRLVRQRSRLFRRTLTDNDIRALQVRLHDWVDSGEAFPDLVRRINEVVVNEARAANIAATEATRAFAEGQRAYWKDTGVVNAQRWNTANDELVCFPAWTAVATRHGQRPIQRICPGEMVQTRQGMRRVVAVSRRQYKGRMASIRTTLGKVTATDEHPFWVQSRGWVSAGRICRGELLQSVGEQPVEVIGVEHFGFGDADDAKTSTVQVSVLGNVPSRIAVPEYPVHFQGYSSILQQEVHRIAPDLGLTRVGDPKAVEAFGRHKLERAWTAKSTVTCHRTKAPLTDISRANPEPLSTVCAMKVYRGSAAFLRTIVTWVPFLGIVEGFTAAAAALIDSLGQSALSAASCIAVRHGLANSELPGACRTSLSLHDRSGTVQITTTRAELTARSEEAFIEIERPAAMRALDVFAHSLALMGSKLHLLVAVRHLWPWLNSLALLYHRLYSKPVWVYDIQVEGAHEFYANGLLVHNCPICRPLDGVVVPLGETWPGGYVQPSHPSCRCWPTPVVVRQGEEFE